MSDKHPRPPRLYEPMSEGTVGVEALPDEDKVELVFDLANDEVGVLYFTSAQFVAQLAFKLIAAGMEVWPDPNNAGEALKKAAAGARVVWGPSCGVTMLVARDGAPTRIDFLEATDADLVAFFNIATRRELYGTIRELHRAWRLRVGLDQPPGAAS